jgi:hypothetical protein
MTQPKGTGLFMVWADVLADKEADFNRQYQALAQRKAGSACGRQVSAL